jgi:hypothetical protein
MCWKYEDVYSDKTCFDHLFFSGTILDKGTSLPEMLEKFGVRIVDESVFERAFFVFLSQMHDDKIIKPKILE